MEKILTISIAAYNVEDYISNCLKTIADSEVLDDIEVFVIDDGGTDGSLKIARAYEEKYPGVIHAIHKENQGYGSTINYSIENATGKYFKTLDGDDWVDSQGLRELVKILKSIDTDVVITNYKKGDNSKALKERKLSDEVGEQGEVEISTLKPIEIAIWAITYRTELLRECGMKLPENTPFTDQIYDQEPFVKANSIRFLDIGVYCYRTERDGQSVTRESRIKNCDKFLSICERVCDIQKEEQASKNNVYLLCRATSCYYQSLKTILLKPANKENYQYYKKFDQNIKSQYPAVYSSLMKTENLGKSGMLLKIIRKTNYKGYWLIKLIPGGLPNWK